RHTRFARDWSSDVCSSDLAQNSAAHRGALYGPSANSRWTAFRRPHNRCPDVRGLYFVGGTTHPGGGVPMVMLSAQVVSKLVSQRSEERRVGKDRGSPRALA